MEFLPSDGQYRSWLRFRDPYRQTPQGLRMLLGAFHGGTPLERIVAKPTTESGRHAVRHKKGLGVIRTSGNLGLSANEMEGISSSRLSVVSLGIRFKQYMVATCTRSLGMAAGIATARSRTIGPG